tara:strand:- start:207 stop:362 length:156 start_codon:yes stop_codon:yes gene_type:complete
VEQELQVQVQDQVVEVVEVELRLQEPLVLQENQVMVEQVEQEHLTQFQAVQ